MSLVLTAPQNSNFLPSATIKVGLHQVVISNVEDLGMVPVGAEILAKNKAQAVKEGRDTNTVKTEQPKARVFFSNAIGEFIAKDYTVSLNDRAGLKLDMDAIGKTLKYGDSLLAIIGAQAQLMAVPGVSKKGNKFIKIGTLTVPAPGQNVPIPNPKPTTEAAKKSAAAVGGTSVATPNAHGVAVRDEDIPF